MISLNGYVMCAPFVKVEEEGSLRSLRGVSAYVTLAKTKAVASANVFVGQQLMVINPGTLVFVRGDRTNTAWARERLKVEGVEQEFILVPVSEVIAIVEPKQGNSI